MDYDSYLSVIRGVDELVGMLEHHSDERTRQQVLGLLSGIDALHREGLERLVARLRDFSGEALVERLGDDPVVATLLGLYGLADLRVPDEEPAPGPVTGFVPIEDVGFVRKGDRRGAEPEGA